MATRAAVMISSSAQPFIAGKAGAATIVERKRNCCSRSSTATIVVILPRSSVLKNERIHSNTWGVDKFRTRRPSSGRLQARAITGERAKGAGAGAKVPVQQGDDAAPSSSSRKFQGEDKAGDETEVIVIGAGLAGLAAAIQLAEEGIKFRVLEASDGVGGRVRTDNVEGFLLDRGFQIHITAYPEAARILDYGKLNLKNFYAGASVWFDGKFHRVADPFRHFTDGLLSLANPIGNAYDKVLVGIVRFRAAIMSSEDILTSEETSILERLVQTGFSSAMVDRFFRPFFGGIFFDTELQTTSRLFDFVFKCLALGSNALPGGGIGTIPEQLAARLPSDSLSLNSRVAEVMEGNGGTNGAVMGVKLDNGTVLTAWKGIIVAVDGPEATRLLKTKLPDMLPTTAVEKPPRSTVCLYFSSSDSQCPTKDPILFLNGTGKGIVNNMFFPSSVAPECAPPGKYLVSVSLIGTFEDDSDEELERAVRDELSEWFGAGTVDGWEHLRMYRIPFAQPNQTPPTNLRKDPRVCQGIYVCGDHRDSATFDGALVSGRRAVQALLADKKLAIS